MDSKRKLLMKNRNTKHSWTKQKMMLLEKDFKIERE